MASIMPGMPVDPELCNDGAPDLEHYDIFGADVSTADLMEAFAPCHWQRTANIMSSEMSLSSIKPCPNLPTELWTTILLDAIAPVTIIPHRRQGFPRELELLLRRRLFSVMRMLVLVCRLWRAIALPLLYETVQLKTPNMARCFLRTLVESATADPQAGYGLYVRHLVLPLLEQSSEWEGFHIIDVLGCCPNLETLWKPYYSEFHDPSFWHGFSCPHSCTGCTVQPPCTIPTTKKRCSWRDPRLQALVQAKDVRHALSSMTALRHIYWRFSYPPKVVGIEAKRLSKLLSYTPNVIALSMTGSGGSISPKCVARIQPNIPLTYLTKVECCKNTKRLILSNNMPNLTHIVTTAETLKYRSHISVLTVFGHQLQVIEFLDPWTWGPFYNSIALILLRCPKVHTVKYNVNRYNGVNEMMGPPHRGIVLHKSLRNIVLRINPRKQDDERLLERCLPRHFDVLIGVAFPALSRVVLEGVVGCDGPFQQAYTVMSRRFPVQRIDGQDIVWER